MYYSANMSSFSTYELVPTILLTSLAFGLTGVFADIVNVQIVSMTSVQYLMVTPGYESGVYYANNRYGSVMNLTHHLIYRQDLYSCEAFADHSVELASKFYYTRQGSSWDLLVFDAPMCTVELLLLGPVTREWNVPVVSLIGQSALTRNRKRYPTVLSMGLFNNFVLMTFIKIFLRLRGWTTVMLLCDANNIIAYYRTECVDLQAGLRPPEFLISALVYDSSADDVDYKAMLFAASRAARIVFVVARSDVVRQVMIHAYEANMMHDYVYLYVEPHSDSYLPEFPNLVWRKNDSHDGVVKIALTSMLRITFDNEPLIAALPDDAANFIRERSGSRYNITIPAGQKVSALAVAAFQSVMVIGRVVNESLVLTPSIELSDGKALMDRFLNRTFYLPTGPLHITPGGEKLTDITVSQLDSGLGIFQPILLFDAATTVISQPFGRELSWSGGRAPVNEPLCGYTGQKCIDDESQGTTRALEGAMTGLTGLLLTAAGLFFYRYCVKKKQKDDFWWQLADFEPLLDQSTGTLRST